MMSDLASDLRHGWKQLRRTPGFTVTAVLTLALGIGATTAIFSVIEAVFLQPLEFPAPGSIVSVHEAVPQWAEYGPELTGNIAHVRYWQQHARSFQALAAYQPARVTLGGGNGRAAEDAMSLQVSEDFFRVLGFAPHHGRGFTGAEMHPGQSKVVVLGDALWRARFHADPGLPGKPIVIDGIRYTVVGILPPHPQLPKTNELEGTLGVGSEPALLTPLALEPDWYQNWVGDHDFEVIGRLNAGVSVEQARAELNTLDRAMKAQYFPAERIDLSALVEPLGARISAPVHRGLPLLLASAALVLLLGCVNIGGLLLVRALGRERDLAVRTALGATRACLIRAQMAEVLLLGLGGWMAGLVLAATAIRALARYAPASVPRIAHVRMDATALLFSSLLMLGCVVVCSAFPLLRLRRITVRTAMAEDTVSVAGSREGRRLRSALLAGEVLLSMLLLSLAGMVGWSLVRLLHVDRGFASDHVLSARVTLPQGAYGEAPARERFWRDALRALRAIPGVRTAGMVSALPLTGQDWGDGIQPDGSAHDPARPLPAQFRFVSPGFAESLRISLREGRLLDERDLGTHNVVINERAARDGWPGRSALGRQFHRGDPAEAPFTVIGVLADTRSVRLEEAVPHLVYLPYTYRTRLGCSVVLRTEQDPDTVADALRATLEKVEPGAAVSNIRSMDAVVDESVSLRRFQVQLLVLFAMTALALSLVGVYGTVAYAVGQRRREFGIRMALGAARRDVFALTTREGMLPVAAGLLLGLAGAWWCARLLGSLLFQSGSFDGVSAACAAAVLLVPASVAVLLPARSAALTDPMQALRRE